MSEEPRQNLGRGLVDRKLVEAPSNIIAGRPTAALLFCLLLNVLFFFLASFIVDVSVVSVYLVCVLCTVATCPSIPAARFAFCLCSFWSFVLFLVFVVVLSGEPKQNQRPWLADLKLVQAPSNFIAGHPKVPLLF